MRLNRVLLLAATISMMMFALVFTISCSGDDGKNGANGKNCTAEPNSTGGWNVICEGDDEPIGVLQGTGDRNGADGAPGQDGTPGKDGSFCILGNQTITGIEIKCNGEVKGNLDACTIENVQKQSWGTELLISCGKTTKISVCNGRIFDPIKKYCQSTNGALGDAVDNTGKCQDGKTYSKSTQYCGYTSKTATKRTPLKKCTASGNQPNEGTDNTSTYSSASACIAADGDAVYKQEYFQCWVGGVNVGPSAGGGDNSKTTETACKSVNNSRVVYKTVFDKCITNEWTAEYCKYYSPKSITEKAVVDSSYRCPALASGATVNEGKWQGQYCGYLEKANGKNLIQSVQTGLCDDFDDSSTGASAGKNKGPNEDAYGLAYCQVLWADKNKGTTTYSKDNGVRNGSTGFCGVASKNKINDGKWASQYCGYTKPEYDKDNKPIAGTSKQEKIYTDICDDGNGPNKTAYNAGYCEVTYANRLSGSTTFQPTFCGTSGKPNNNKWNWDYCGFKNKNSTSADRVYNQGLCGDGNGPSQNSWNPDEYCRARISSDGKDSSTVLTTEACENGDKVNIGSWKGEYCGYATETAEKTSRQTGGCTDDQGPNAEKFGGGYCKSDKDGITEYTSEFCGEDGTPNNGSWKSEYCGYENATSVTADKVLTGVCDNGIGPNESSFGAGYCRWTEETSKGTEWTDFLCGTDKVNEGSWKGEYCYSDLKPAVCTGGWLPNIDKKSTDPYTVRCTYTSTDLICSESNLAFCDKDGCEDLGAGFSWNEDAFECRATESAD